MAAARAPADIAAVASRGGRPDLAGHALAYVDAPTLLIVGAHDRDVIELNERALEQLRCVKELAVVPGATHLFDEPGTLDEVADSPRIGSFGIARAARLTKERRETATKATVEQP